jgi:hypothetical protein
MSTRTAIGSRGRDEKGKARELYAIDAPWASGIYPRLVHGYFRHLRGSFCARGGMRE